MVAFTTTPLPSRLERLVSVRACWIKSGPVVQGRAALRVPFDEPVVITPWEDGAHRPDGAALLATGRDLSPTGLSFTHPAPLPFRVVAVSFRGDGLSRDGGPAVETVLVRLLWCRFLKQGGYISDGRFAGSLGTEFGEPLSSMFTDGGSRQRAGVLRW